MYSTTVINSTYKRNYNAIKGFLKGISNNDSRINPEPEGNNINWVLGHIIGYRSIILETLKQKPFWDEETFAPYSFKSPPLPENKGFSLETLLDLLDKSQDALTSAMEQTDDAFLETRLSDGETPVGARLDFYAWHEGYHLGQLALLRRMIGKGSAF